MPNLPMNKPTWNKLTAPPGRQIKFTESGDRLVPGLALWVAPSGRKSWNITVRRPGEKNPSRLITSAFQEMDLTVSRIMALQFNTDLREGIDPFLERRSRCAPTWVPTQ
jgi:hypothetical protein